jgi:LacI family transcriptional regulator
MPSPKLLPLYAQIAGRIAEQIEAGQFAPGQRIYSIREICETFHVADVTAKKAISHLRSRGLIHTINGSGAYVSESGQGHEPASDATDNRTVAFVKIGKHPAAVFTHEIDLLQRELAQLDHPMLYAIVQSEHELEMTIQQLQRLKPCGLLVFPPHHDYDDIPGSLAKLATLGAPMLVMESRRPRMSYITTNTERATMELANYLYDLGHRRICLATNFARKVAGFEAAVERWNNPDLQYWIIGEPGKADADSRQLAEHLMAMDPWPTAVIAADDHAAAIMVSTFMQHGLNVPGDISVVTYGDHPQSRPLSPVPMTVMRHPFVEIAQEAARWVHEQRQPRARHRMIKREITGTLIERDSSGPPPQ